MSRELRRNLLRHDFNVYDADLAHARARQRARRQRRTRLIRDPELRRLVEWSSRYLRLIHLPHGHSASQLHAALVVAL